MDLGASNFPLTPSILTIRPRTGASILLPLFMIPPVVEQFRLISNLATDTDADSPFLTPPIPDNSQVDTDIWLPGFDIDSDVLGDLDTLTSNQTRTQPSPLCEAGAMRLERSFDATGNQEYLFIQNSPQSASFSFVDPDAGLNLGPAEILAPAALRADLGWGLTRESVPWPDSETIADGRLCRALLRNRSLRSYPAGMLLEQRGVSTPDTPTLTESSSSFVSTPNTAGSSSASSLMSPSPNPGSLQDEGPGSADPRRATVGSAANVNAALLRRKRPAKFPCAQCGRMFTARHNLKNHENAHNGIRPYSCRKGCGGRFTTASTAARHANTFPSLAATPPSAFTTRIRCSPRSASQDTRLGADIQSLVSFFIYRSLISFSPELVSVSLLHSTYRFSVVSSTRFSLVSNISICV
ncbi:hypothetical protein FB45DRAFT_997030, partial [Roridomyces roridus]